MRNLLVLSLLMTTLTLSVSAFTPDGLKTEEADSAKIVEQPQHTLTRDEEHRQRVEVAKHIKFETDTFYLDITLKEAKKQGLSEEAYNMWLERLKVYTKEAREVIAKGGNYTFINNFATPPSQEDLEFEKLFGYIKFSRDTCYLSISLEEALKLGFSEKAYRRCAVRTKRHQAFRGALSINNGDSAEISDRNRPTPEIKEWRRQDVEVAKHLKWKNGTYYLDITLEEAQKRGIDEDLYYMWLYRIDDLNKKPATPQP